ncbi:MAG TPA: peptidylprolyl isomerase [Candidatus Omnitrophota bacterium]|nr:peptidylprolyl isomerase [Candidatus Omnitrophota bacterium]
MLKLYFIISALVLCLSGCGKSETIDKKDIIGYVNKEPILASDLARDIELRAKQDPSFRFTPETQAEQLDILIDKKIITQEAIKQGLARKDRFVNTIKAFWEQTLIRDFIETKKEEFGDSIIITEDDIDKYYSKLSERVTFKAIKAKDKKYLQNAKAEFERNKDSTLIPWQVVGPVGYDDLAPGVLMDSFDMPLGDVKIVDMDPDYYLIYMSARDKRLTEPLDNIRSDIEKRVRELKDREMFEDWLKKERKKARVTMIDDADGKSK